MTLPIDAHTSLRRRVGDTPLLFAQRLADTVGLPHLHLKLEGANPTGTQKDRIARLEVQEAVAQGAQGVSVASCGNFGVAMAHAAHAHEIECHIFVPADFAGERIVLMEDLAARVHRVDGTYEHAVLESSHFAELHGMFDGNPGGVNTLRTLTGYSRIATEIVDRLGSVPLAVGLPIGNGSTLAGVHLGFRIAWTQQRIGSMPQIIGGTSQGNSPVPASWARGQTQCSPLDPRSVEETEVNEPLVNWDALDGDACLTAILDSGGAAYGFNDDELMELHAALQQDGIDAHPASLSSVACLREAAVQGVIPRDQIVVAVLTSGRPQVTVDRLDGEDDVGGLDVFLGLVQEWLGPWRDPAVEMRQAFESAFDEGFVLVVRDAVRDRGYVALTPMVLSDFFPRYHLSYIVTDPEVRGLGLGTMLLEEAIRVTSGDLSLHVDLENESALKLYEKFSFTKKYYRMLYQGRRTTDIDPATGSGWGGFDGDGEAEDAELHIEAVEHGD